jgi:hypothetical protein
VDTSYSSTSSIEKQQHCRRPQQQHLSLPENLPEPAISRDYSDFNPVRCSRNPAFLDWLALQWSWGLWNPRKVLKYTLDMLNFTILAKASGSLLLTMANPTASSTNLESALTDIEVLQVYLHLFFSFWCLEADRCFDVMLDVYARQPKFKICITFSLTDKTYPHIMHLAGGRYAWSRIENSN